MIFKFEYTFCFRPNYSNPKIRGREDININNQRQDQGVPITRVDLSSI